MAGPPPKRHSPPTGWDHALDHARLSNVYRKDEDWLLAAAASSKTLADFGNLAVTDQAAGGNTSALRPSLSQAQLSSLPSLHIRARVRDTILGCDPDDIIETRDWTSTTHRLHGPMSRMQPRAAGSQTKFGIRDTTGKVSYLPTRYGTAEALGAEGVSYWQNKRPQSSPSLKTLRPSPSMEELDLLLVRRSQTRGRGGHCTQMMDRMTRSQWNIKNGASSGMSVMRPHALGGGG